MRVETPFVCLVRSRHTVVVYKTTPLGDCENPGFTLGLPRDARVESDMSAPNLKVLLHQSGYSEVGGGRRKKLKARQDSDLLSQKTYEAPKHLSVSETY